METQQITVTEKNFNGKLHFLRREYGKYTKRNNKLHKLLGICRE